MVRDVGFAQAFSFKYSPRPGTPAARMGGQVAEAVKSDRLRRLQALFAASGPRLMPRLRTVQSLGADPIIAVDLDEQKLEFAKAFGATHGINASAVDPVEAIHAMTTKADQFTIFKAPVSGADYAFDCIGIRTTMEQIVPACRSGHFGAGPGGMAVLVGVPTTPVELNAIDVLINEKQFIGSIGGSCAPDRDFPRFLEWYDSGELDLDQLVTARYRLDQINEATDALQAGRIQGRAILEFD